MKRILLFLVLIYGHFCVSSQVAGFPFGQATYRELDMRTYLGDTTAAAVVLNEFGDAYMADEDPFNLVFTVHRKIKILRKAGLDYANVEIPLRKQEGLKESVRSIKASSFTMENGSMRETALELKNIFTENRSKYWDVRVFAIPNAEVGSVIEYQYIVESPFKFTFRSWYFQWDIPKVRSEYWALIPGNYLYNVTLKGFLGLSRNENEIVRGCYKPAGRSADCVRYKFAMNNIPAFVEEDYMTARSNFVAAINFELSELRHFDGRVNKITKEWKDAEDELRRHADFGVQLRRSDSDLEAMAALTAVEPDLRKRARMVYDLIKGWYRWNENTGMLSEFGIKKAFAQKNGNVADINLSLVTALRAAGLDAEPVVLSTRENGLPTEIHPVLSDFNYVVAKVNIGDKVYLADATDDLHPFGILPERCLNGKGRVFGEKESYWYQLMPGDRSKNISVLSLKMENDGLLSGSLQTSFFGYEAIEQRRKILAYDSQDDYMKALGNGNSDFAVTGGELSGLDSIHQPLVQRLEIEMQAFDDEDAQNFLFNPFLIRKWQANPFRSNERLYPVDFGMPREYTMVLNMEYPEGFEISNLPEKTGLSLPNAAGHYIVEAQNTGRILSIRTSMVLRKSLFTSQEYHYLRELFSRMIQIQQGDLLFRRKS